MGSRQKCPPFGCHTVMSQPPKADRAGPHPNLLSSDGRSLLKCDRPSRHAAPSSASVLRSDACTVQRTSCATRTFAHGHAHAASPRDSPIHNTEPHNGRTDVAIRNSRRGRKSDPEFFCCVTTRPGGSGCSVGITGSVGAGGSVFRLDLRSRASLAAAARSSRTSGRCRRTRCRFAACQRCTCRKHSGS